MLTSDELQRYTRQLSLIGKQGQESLKDAKVLIAGAGGLSSPLSMHLVAAGVGTIGLVDHDIVEVSNLNRQTLYGTENLGTEKVTSARKRLHSINPFS